MKEEDLRAITDSIESKIGKEASGLIADDLGKLFTSNIQTLNTLSSNSEEIKRLKDTNEKLVIANGNLLQQVPMAPEYDKHPSDDGVKENKKSFNFRDAFDDKGNFKRK